MTCYSGFARINPAYGFIGVMILAMTLPVQAQDLPTINFLSSNDTSCSVYPQFVMQEFGYLEEEGYKLNILSSATTVPYVAFLANGDADVTVLDSAQVLQAVEAGNPIKVVYSSFQFATEGIVVSADSPIQSLADLKGKTIGLASDRDLTTTVIALDTVGLTLDDVETAVVGESGPVLANALKIGQIDAFAGGNTDRAGIEAAGMAIRNITPPEVSNNPGNQLVVWGPTLEEKRPLILAFTRAWAKAQHAGILETSAVYMACKKAVPEQWEVQGNGQRIVNSSAYVFQLRRTIKYGEMQPDVWKAIQPPYVKLKEISREIDPEEFLDSSFIEEVNTITTDDVKRGIARFKKANPDLTVPN